MNDRSVVWSQKFWNEQHFEGKLLPIEVAICSWSLQKVFAQEIPVFADLLLHDYSDPVLSDLSTSLEPTLKEEGEKLDLFLKSNDLFLPPVVASGKLSKAIALGIRAHQIDERFGAHLLFEVWSQFRTVIKDKEGSCCLTSPKVPMAVQKYWQTEDMFYESHLGVVRNRNEELPATEPELEKLRETLQSYAQEIVSAG